MAERKRRIAFDRFWWKLQPAQFQPGRRISTMRAYEARKAAFYEGHQIKDSLFNVEVKDVKIGTVRIKDVTYNWSYNITTEFIQADTYPDWDRDKFRAQLKTWYGTHRVFLIILGLEIVSVEPPQIALDAFGAQATPNPVPLPQDSP